MPTDPALTYTNYLRLDQILSAQHPLSENPSGEAEHDEMLFIIIHQVFELWFKQLLHELDYACMHIRDSELGAALHVLKRVRSIVKVMVSQVDVLETMTPVEFSAFRSRLDQASGLQSYQFREVEFLLGFKRTSVLTRYPEGSEAHKKLAARLNAPTLWDAFLSFLAQRNYPIPTGVLNREVTEPVEHCEEVVDILESVYRTDPEAVQLCESLTDLDEGIQEWRYRHIKMVQRTIGMKMGTGGSEGAPYLMATLDNPFFPDLWIVRSRL
jgi:tryptophan 2,3-dioxygenase